LRTLGQAGIEVVYLGQETSVQYIAGPAADANADAVEVCLAGGRALGLLRDLLRELKRLGQDEVSIVVHRVE
jgi:methylmalonyl-CoA mutase cobalamin-binding subunit